MRKYNHKKIWLMRVTHWNVAPSPVLPLWSVQPQSRMSSLVSPSTLDSLHSFFNTAVRSIFFFFFFSQRSFKAGWVFITSDSYLLTQTKSQRSYKILYIYSFMSVTSSSETIHLAYSAPATLDSLIFLEHSKHAFISDAIPLVCCSFT